jgi:hypothetical protein
MNDEMSLQDFGNSTSRSNRARVKSRPDSPVEAPGPSKDKDHNSTTLVQWANCGPNTFKPVSNTFAMLDRGVYSVSVSQYHGLMFTQNTINIDELLRFPDSLSEKILAEITTFWKKGKKFKEHGFLHRRGYLLHGPAGSGKTCLVQQIIADIVNADGLVFLCNTHPSVFNDGLSLFRKVEPDRPVVCLFEDIDAIIDEHGEDEILTLLDGENQIDRVLNIATTNYPEKLDKRLVARPRRFDRVIKIGMPGKEVRKVYFQKKLKVTDSEMEKWLESTEGFSFAACAELVISVCCFEKPFDEAVKTLTDMMTTKVSSADYNDKMGFTGAMK